LLGTRVEGQAALAPGNGGAARPMADLSGRIDYRPWSGRLEWSLALEGTTLRERGPPGWRIAPWEATLGGDAARMGVALSLGGAELQAAWGVVSVGEARLQGHVRRDPEGWPFRLELTISEVVNRGFPYARLSGLRHGTEGRVTPGAAGEGATAGPVGWQTRQTLEADSSYGPLRADARALGLGGGEGGGQLTGLHLDARLPRGLWALLERLEPALAQRLARSGLVRADAEGVRLDALYRDGAWQARVGDAAP
jgi:hypothetical protein